MRSVRAVIIAMVLLVGLHGCDAGRSEGGKQPVELTVSAAASLQDALKEVKTAFEHEHPNIRIHYNFGSSGALQKQIAQGAPVDLFFSAAVLPFEELKKEGLIDSTHEKTVVANELVLIVPKQEEGAIQSLDDITRAKRVAIGIPESVPAGIYAKQTLERAGLWENVEPRLVLAKDVRQVLTYVETGNVDAGFVYRTDALVSGNVHIATAVPDEMHEPIVYPLGVVKTSKHLQEARQFYAYLTSEQALKQFEQYGFRRAH
ncbi:MULTISPECIES: molybdate ABC transporter substrate-binding protein [Geobacillus]|jgi:molybdate transport system substrate-binding protein|uniref:Molybdate ABC transporter substrate-binding protein n=2 Tax=Geobacillus thermodenitrificans TaxID=33940 RepID=A0ABY9QBH4_GEOTD|nr:MULTISPECIES: molybdate ABC transporter substrate-binding protein [Geobacillus]ABO67976.1 Putative molybdate binding protein YvgL [Geobacillus thermodenitrificans NG80-2]ARA98861.1 molybdate ABC transporter substrate-binding protein [Geobacillus thermodenitrificans]ATO38229.1 molybdate ABC transporter substrate-binding protein [Geobacillus thermodenitrificans]MED3716740.1 molybdate ABC transporter substrate-binding protein [Geobacillus thermodenitrificans]MED4917911.1 molybdate ABC transpor